METPLSAAYFTVSLPTPPKEVVVVLAPTSGLMRYLDLDADLLPQGWYVEKYADQFAAPPWTANKLPRLITAHAPGLAPKFSALSPVQQPVNGV